MASSLAVMSPCLVRISMSFRLAAHDVIKFGCDVSMSVNKISVFVDNLFCKFSVILVEFYSFIQ